MEEIIIQLETYLNEYFSLYLKLSDLVLKESRILINRNITAVEEIINEKKVLLDKIADFEKMLSEYQKKLSYMLTEDSKTLLTLKDICNRFSPSSTHQLKELQTGLKNTVNKIRRINKINTGLIKHHLEYASFFIKKLEGDKPLSTYSASGKINASKGGAGVLFEQRL